jgi:F420-non-reducing hydrogenase small subunit
VGYGTVSAQLARKRRIGMYWAAGCGGCDISALEIGPGLLDLLDAVEVVFWPCIADFKYKDVAAYPDGHLDVCLLNGGIRNAENERVLRLLRRKSRTLVAYGTCAVFGGLPALANLASVSAILETVYRNGPSTVNPEGVAPRARTQIDAGELELPYLHPQVLRLQDAVPIDYQVPGCPPQLHQVERALALLLNGAPAPQAHGAMVGCGDKSVCEECPREKRQHRIAAFRRTHEAIPEDGFCLLEQGFVCLGPATRSGCGAVCLKANRTCRGCYGPGPEVEDQGMAMIGALGSLLDADTEERAREMIDQIPDPAGTFYRFTLAASHLKGGRTAEGSPEQARSGVPGRGGAVGGH